MLSIDQGASVPGGQQPHDAWSEFVVAVLRLNGLIMRAGEGIARPIGQSSARWQVLGRAFRSQTVAAMASDMGHARQSVQRVADALAAEGLITYTDHPSDRRTKLAELTPQGLDVLARIHRRQLEWSQRVVAKLGAAHLAQVTDALDEIGTALEPEITAGVAAASAPVAEE
jgi:DNA-binding MarR family transcriptional regulator